MPMIKKFTEGSKCRFIKFMEHNSPSDHNSSWTLMDTCNVMYGNVYFTEDYLKRAYCIKCPFTEKEKIMKFFGRKLSG